MLLLEQREAVRGGKGAVMCCAACVDNASCTNGVCNVGLGGKEFSDVLQYAESMPAGFC